MRNTQITFGTCRVRLCAGGGCVRVCERVCCGVECRTSVFGSCRFFYSTHICKTYVYEQVHVYSNTQE